MKNRLMNVKGKDEDDCHDQYLRDQAGKHGQLGSEIERALRELLERGRRLSDQREKQEGQGGSSGKVGNEKFSIQGQGIPQSIAGGAERCQLHAKTLRGLAKVLISQRTGQAGASASSSSEGAQRVVAGSGRFSPQGSADRPGGRRNAHITYWRNGHIIGKAQLLHGNMKPMAGGVPVAKGSQYRGGVMAERRWSDHEGFHIDVIGHQLLGSVYTKSALAAQGQRLAGGIFVMSPDALGERLLLLSQQYEQHRVKKLKLVYKPTVPSTEAGAVAFYFRNDPNTPMDITGVDELAHASTHPAFAQTQVWQDVSIDIKPSDATTKYFSTDTGDARFQVQGIVTVESASPLPASTTYGNLYLEYEICFSGEELDYEVADVSSGSFAGAWLTFDTTTVQGDGVVLTMQAGGGPGALAEIVAGSAPPNVNYLLYGTVTGTAGTPPTVFVPGSAEPKTLATGQGIFIRFGYVAGVSTDFTNGTIYAVLFYDLGSAVAWVPNVGFAAGVPPSEAGQLTYNDAAVYTGSVGIDWRSYQLTYD